MYERQIGPTYCSNVAVGIGWLKIAENWAVLKKTTRFRGSCNGYNSCFFLQKNSHFRLLSSLPGSRRNGRVGGSSGCSRCTEKNFARADRHAAMPLICPSYAPLASHVPVICTPRSHMPIICAARQCQHNREMHTQCCLPQSRVGPPRS